MFNKIMIIDGFNNELWQAIQGEKQRQEDHIELIRLRELCQFAGNAGIGVCADE